MMMQQQSLDEFSSRGKAAAAAEEDGDVDAHAGDKAQHGTMEVGGTDSLREMDHGTREQLKQTIKDWVQCDADIVGVQGELKKKRADKKRVSDQLMKIMSTHQIDCFDIQNGQIVYNRKVVKKPVTAKKMLEILGRYFNGDTEQVLDITNYILENRENVLRQSITRK